MRWFWQRHRDARDDRLEESREAIRKQERLGDVIEWQRQEAAAVAEWARDRLQRNHLTDLFLSSRGGHR